VLPNNSYCQEKSALEDKRLQLLERKKAIEERTVQSSERSISLLRDSEQIGVATAEVGILLRFRLCSADSVVHCSYVWQVFCCMHIEFRTVISWFIIDIFLFLDVQELIRQREQLERTEKRLDEINNTLRFSQKHIQGIKVNTSDNICFVEVWWCIGGKLETLIIVLKFTFFIECVWQFEELLEWKVWRAGSWPKLERVG
jgi:hypothetical protein